MTERQVNVFISYSHKDPLWFEKIAAQLESYATYLRIEAWSDKRIMPGFFWKPAIDRAIDQADAAVLLVSDNFLSSSFIQKHELPRLESKKQSKNILVAPIILSPCPWKLDPFLSQLEVRPKGATLSDWDQPSAQGQQIHDCVAAIVDAIISMGEPALPDRPIPPRVYDLGRIPSYSGHLVGRRQELALLDSAWSDPTANAVGLIAWGGAGKTSLAKRWAISVRKDGGRGAEAIWGWSFYNQGTKVREQSSSEFFRQACSALSIEFDPKDQDVDLAKRLADWCKMHRALMILDGLEPLQRPPGSGDDQFRIADTALKLFIVSVTQQNKGLVVVTSRFPLVDLNDYQGSGRESASYRTVDLEALTTAEGVDLLTHLGVEGEPPDLEETVKELEGHCLSITILGALLRQYRRGRIEAWLENRHFFSSTGSGGARHAWRVVEAYDREWLLEHNGNEGSGVGRLARQIMLAVGLFDRPVSLDILRRLPTAGDRTLLHELAETSHDRLTEAIDELRSGQLLAASDVYGPLAGELECHPLIREWFGNKFREEDQRGWVAANGAIFDKLLSVGPASESPTKDELGVLYQAIPHGIKAGRAGVVYRDLFRSRMRKGNANYTVNQLGLWSDDLQAIAAFFQGNFENPVDGLLPEEVTWLRNESAFCLRSIGRLADAAVRWREALADAEKQGSFEVAANVAGHLADVCRFSGPISEALEAGVKAVKYSVESKKPLQEALKRTSVAAALHMMGRLADSEREFRLAEQQERGADPARKYMRSRRAFHFAELLIEVGKIGEAIARSKELIYAEGRDEANKLDQALPRLALAKAWLKKGQAQRSKFLPRLIDFRFLSSLKKSQKHIAEAGRLIGGAKDYIYECTFHLTMAEIHLENLNHLASRSELINAKRAISRGSILLLDVDSKVLELRLLLNQPPQQWHNGAGDQGDYLAEARELVAEARAVSKKIGYARRVQEILELEARLELLESCIRK